MKRTRNLHLWLLLSSPLVCAANDLVFPELGVKLSDLPTLTAGSAVFQRPTASEVITPIGSAILSVRREDREVPSGSGLSDPTFRAALQSRFDKTLDTKAQGAMTAVGGSPGWTLIDAHKEARSPLALYTCITYVIADRHLYRFMVRAVAARTRPAEFDAVVKAISNVTFTSTSGPRDTVPGSSAAPGAMKLPPSVGDPGSGRIVGPKQHEQGVVNLEFSIDGQGHVQGAKLLYAEPRTDGVLGLVYLQNRLFGVPADWEESGSHNLRFTLEFQFPVAAAGVPCEGTASPPRIPDTPVVRVCLNGS
jgi:hypothetical protein